MARLAQVSGDGWAADRPMGHLGRTLILGKKRLRGKTVKTHHCRQYKKRALSVHSRDRTMENVGEQRKWEEKHKR